jgi:hypothetical protein
VACVGAQSRTGEIDHSRCEFKALDIGACCFEAIEDKTGD